MEIQEFPTISIVIGVYNGADKIGACLESLLKQNYPAEAYEIIVVENGSTDNTTEIVEKYPVRLFHNSIRGLAPARNFGLARSEAEIIATTDADCIAHPNWLSELVKPYADPSIGGVGGAILAYDHPGRNIVERFSDENAPLVNFISGSGEFLPHLCGANASFRRQLLNQIEGYNPKILTAEDIDVSWRIQLQTGTRLQYAPQAIIYHHHRTDLNGLGRLYRHYGFGEILLDTMYRQYPGYPRHQAYQIQRILKQSSKLPVYLLSALLRRLRLAMGRATPYQAVVPRLWFLIESQNVRGKLDGLIATRFMTEVKPVFEMDSDKLIGHLFGS